MTLDRYDLRNLANLRAKDARVLLDSGQYDAGYYLAGYAVECALKAVFAARTRQYEFPDKDLANKAYTHDLTKLLELSGLKTSIDQEFRKDPELSDNWNIVRGWSEDSRYETGRQKDEADALHTAITDQDHGILSCISKYR